MATKMLNTVMMVDTVREEEKVIMVEVMAGEEEGVIVEAEETAVGEAEETAEEGAIAEEEVEDATEQQSIFFSTSSCLERKHWIEK